MSKVLSFEQEFTRQVDWRPQLLRFIREAIDVEETQWEDLTKVNLLKVAAYIKNRVSPNSAKTYFAEINAFLHCYEDEGIVPCKHPEEVLKSKREPSQHVALTEEEVLKWDKYVPKTQRERDVKIMFMRGCLTGARCSDCKRMTMDNIHDGILTYVSQKTHTEVRQPVHHLLPKYLVTQPSQEYKTVQVCRVIRHICKVLGINEEVSLYVAGKVQKGPKYEFITMHTSRRSYCSCLAMRRVPIEVISKLAGHSNAIITSKHYICIDTKQLDDAAMAFFNG